MSALLQLIGAFSTIVNEVDIRISLYARVPYLSSRGRYLCLQCPRGSFVVHSCRTPPIRGSTVIQRRLYVTHTYSSLSPPTRKKKVSFVKVFCYCLFNVRVRGCFTGSQRPRLRTEWVHVHWITWLKKLIIYKRTFLCRIYIGLQYILKPDKRTTSTRFVIQLARRNFGIKNCTQYRNY